MANDELVSVIIPTYFRNEYLSWCLNCIEKQTYNNIEIIVVDDSGNGHAKSVVEDRSLENVKYIELDKNYGPQEARNRGIEVASGTFIQLLDDDDYLAPTKIQKQVDVFHQHPDVGVVYCGFESRNGKALPIDAHCGDVLKEALEFELLACITSTMLMRASALDEIHPLPKTPGSDDTHLKIGLAAVVDFGYVREDLVTKNKLSNNRGQSFGAVEGTYQVLDRYENLYEKFDESVYLQAKSKAIKREVKYLAKNNLWSARAIFLSIKRLKIDPHPSKTTCLFPLVVLFGKMTYLPCRVIARKF